MHHRRNSCRASSKDDGGSARQPPEPADRVAGGVSRAVGGADHEKDRRDIRQFSG